jgi:hypothetical protein
MCQEEENRHGGKAGGCKNEVQVQAVWARVTEEEDGRIGGMNMNSEISLVVGVAAFDLLLLTLLGLFLRAHPPLGRRTLFAVAAGLLGFVFQAFLCYSGAFLVLQLATIAGIASLCCLQSFRTAVRR